MKTTSERTDLLAVIPARGGSKRLPGKNIREFFGKPLIAHAIEAALESRLFARVVVSTDDPATADIARRWGADVPFMRDEQLADDQTPVSLATLDVLLKLDPEGMVFHSVAQLMANCPFRTANDIECSHEQFAASGACSQISVTRYGWENPWWAMRRAESGALQPLFPEQVVSRSQDLPELFCPTGAIWWARAETLRTEKTFHVQGRTGWEIPWERALDIDTEDDWKMAVLIKRLYDR